MYLLHKTSGFGVQPAWRSLIKGLKTDKQRLDVEKTKTEHWLNVEKLSALITVFPKG